MSIEIELAFDEWPEQGTPPLAEICQVFRDHETHYHKAACWHMDHCRSTKHEIGGDDFAGLGWDVRATYILGGADSGADLIEITGIDPQYKAKLKRRIVQRRVYSLNKGTV